MRRPERAGVSAEEWQRLEQVLDAVLDAPVDARVAVLEAECGGDATLLAAAAALLAACDNSGCLDAPPHGLLDALVAPPGARAGTLLGQWRLVQEIGRGGMAIVFLARHADAELELSAAVKVMPGAAILDDVGVRRFRDERKILAGLNHPSIARLLDGGVEDGLPWFAMEYVAGSPIDAWCDAARLGIDARIALFCRLCDAVQHAHARLIVHRDLKPANVLIDGAGEPKLLDFGIAKLLAPDASAAELTRPGLQPGTLAYAAPEQLRGEAPTTATDVHALGVLLYLLLTGRLPYAADRVAAGRDALLKPSAAVLRTVAPDGAPYAALPATAAAARGSTPERLARRLRGDLDVIIARALQPDPARRYATADALAADLRRHLGGQPVLARPDSAGYRMRKLLSRHPVAAAAAVVATLTLSTFAAVTAVQAERLRAQALVLIAERDKAADVTAFMAGVLASADPYRADGAVPTLREVLDRGAAHADSTLADRPDVHAQLLSAMAPAYFGLGEWDRAGELAARSVAIRRAQPSRPELAAALVYLANVRLNQGRSAEAERHALEALALRRSDPGSAGQDSARIISTLGAALQRQGRLPEAERLLRSLLELEQRQDRPNPRNIAQVARNLGHVLRDQRRYREAVPLYAEAYRLHRAVFTDEHPETANSAVNYGNILFLAGDVAAAEPLLRQGVETKRRLLGTDHQDVAGDQLTLARTLESTGATGEANSLRREAEAVLARHEKR